MAKNHRNSNQEYQDEVYWTYKDRWSLDHCICGWKYSCKCQIKILEKK